MKAGIVRETKDPPDRRVPLTPVQCRELVSRYPDLEIIVQPSGNRCFHDEEYRNEHILLREDLSACDVLFGVKEIDTRCLLEDKTYFFFSHTAKMQPYNRNLLRQVIHKRIRLIDYEYLLGKDNTRVVAFGRWAGVVGAYNGLRGYGMLTGDFDLMPAHDCHAYRELRKQLHRVRTGDVRICLTGGGRVAGGAMEILDAAAIRRVEPEEYLRNDYGEPVYARLDPWHYSRHKKGRPFHFEEYVRHPEQFENDFTRFAFRTDMYIACHFWDPRSPVLLTNEDYLSPSFPIKIIADISCDIQGPIPSTLRASTIAEPFYGYDPVTRAETEPFQPEFITVMAVDNLPGELPRDASEGFGTALSEYVLPELLDNKPSEMLAGATIASQGSLTHRFSYLQDFLDGR